MARQGKKGGKKGGKTGGKKGDSSAQKQSNETTGTGTTSTSGDTGTSAAVDGNEQGGQKDGAAVYEQVEIIEDGLVLRLENALKDASRDRNSQVRAMARRALACYTAGYKAGSHILQSTPCGCACRTIYPEASRTAGGAGRAAAGGGAGGGGGLSSSSISNATRGRPLPEAGPPRRAAGGAL